MQTHDSRVANVLCSARLVQSTAAPPSVTDHASAALSMRFPVRFKDLKASEHTIHRMVSSARLIRSDGLSQVDQSRSSQEGVGKAQVPCNSDDVAINRTSKWCSLARRRSVRRRHCRNLRGRSGQNRPSP